MDTQTPQEGQSWLPLSESAIQFERNSKAIKFVLVQRGSVRAGAWLINGRPVMLVPAASA